MKLTASDFQEVLRQKRPSAGESSRPAKKPRKEEPAKTAPATEVPAAQQIAEGSATPVVAGEPARGLPEKEAVPKPVGAATEEGGVPAITEAAVVVVDLEEEGSAAAGALGAGQSKVAADPPAAKESEVERAPPSTGRELVVRRSGAGERAPREKKREPEGPSRRSAPLPSRPRVEKAQEAAARLAPRLHSVEDAVQTTLRMAGVLTAASVEEVKKMSQASLMDMIMVSMAQVVNGVMGIREEMIQSAQMHAKNVERINKQKRDNEAQARSLAQLHTESRAREEELKRQVKEAERQAKEAKDQAASYEAKLGAAASRLKTLRAHADEQGHQLHHFQNQVARAQEEAKAAAQKIAALEEAVIEAGHQKAGAVAHADEASSRAAEAENKAWEAEIRAKETEAKLQLAKAEAEKAVEVYRSSPAFKKELVEASVEAYVTGFNTCRAKVSAAFKIGDSELEKIRPEEPDDAPAEEGGEGEETGSKES